jgi:hypothetical protein
MKTLFTARERERERGKLYIGSGFDILNSAAQFYIMIFFLPNSMAEQGTLPRKLIIGFAGKIEENT